MLKKFFKLHFYSFAAFLALNGCEQQQPAFDVLIVNGMVFTGDENDDGRLLDIGIQGEEIVFVGSSNQVKFSAHKIIDATGLIVAPGFIDPHTHSLQDLLSSDRNLNINYITQGVTTVFAGNDGDGPIMTGKILSRLDDNGVGTNVALFVGHNSVRNSVLGGDDRAPTETELDQMRGTVRYAMKQGAFGLSAGLYYAPGSFAETYELVALAEEAAAFDGIYESHIRDESSYNVGLIAAIEEALTIGHESGAAVHIAHIKALGVDVWGKSAEIISIIEKAQQSGQRVTADQYPWQASGTHISNAVIPNWAKAGSKEQMHARLRNASLRKQLQTEISENLRKRGGPAALLLVAGPEEFVGNTLEEIADRVFNGDVIEAVLAIVLNGDARVASFNMNEEDIEAFMAQKWVMTSSDGTNGHPRKYASFPRKYAYYVKERDVLSLAEYIRRSTGLTADTFGLCERGYLRKGYAADITIFNPEIFKDQADFSNPKILSTGVEYLFVNGVAAIDEKQTMKTLSGVPIKRVTCSD